MLLGLAAACGGSPAPVAVPTIAVTPPAPADSAAPAPDAPDAPASAAPPPSEACAANQLPAGATGSCETCPPTHDIAHLPPALPAARPAFDASGLREPASIVHAADPGAAAYASALARERAGDLLNARKQYYGVIASTPQSALVPAAYLGFGELFLGEAAQDPTKYDLARQAYEKVVTYPPPTNVLYGYGWYELATVFRRTGDPMRALNGLRKVVEFGAAFAQLPYASDLGADARAELVDEYAAANGDPAAAFAFFHGVSGDVFGSNDATLSMMWDLGLQYEGSARYRDAVVLFRDLAARSPAQACTASSHARQSMCALHPGDAAFVHRTCPDMAAMP
jgi:hypothetical protein